MDFLPALMQLTTTILHYLLGFLIVSCVIQVLVLLERYLHFRYGQKIVPGGDKGIIITGATSGLGLAVAKLMYKKGFTIFACYYNDKEHGYRELMELGQNQEQLANKNHIHKPHLFLIPMDVKSEESVEKCSTQINLLMNTHNIQLHCLLNNAGTTVNTPFCLTDCDAIRSVVDTNLLGTMLVTRQFMQKIIHHKGRVINVSSCVQYFAGRGFLIYGTTKRGLTYFSTALDDELKHYGAMSCCIFPGNNIRNSGICFPQYKYINNMTEQLSAEDAITYKASIDECYGAMYSNYKNILQKSNLTQEQISIKYNIDPTVIESFKKKSEGKVRSQQKSYFGRYVSFLVTKLDGRSESGSLEESGVLDGFEYAISAKNPHRSIYAGNFLFTFISGPSAYLMSHSLSDFLSSYVAKSLEVF